MSDPTSPLPESGAKAPAKAAPDISAVQKLLRFWISPQMLFWGLAGFLAGFLVMWNVELQLIWLAVVCLPAAVAEYRRSGGSGMKQEPLLRVAAAFILWNLAVGLWRNPWALAEYYTLEFLTGSLALPFYLAMIWLVCRNRGQERPLIRSIGWSGFAAAVAGLLWWKYVQTVEHPGARLRNPLVYGGQYPVVAGICMGFTIVSSGIAFLSTQGMRGRVLLLAMVAVTMLATMLTLCRGALLGLFFVPASILAFSILTVMHSFVARVPVRKALAPILHRLKQGWPPMVTALTVAIGFQLTAGHFFPEPPPAADDEAAPAIVVELEKLSSRPAAEYIARADNGRRTLYKMALACVDSWDKHLTGTGLWAAESVIKAKLAPMDHIHSLIVATYVHGGIIGFALFLYLTVASLVRGWQLLAAGGSSVFVLLVYGLGALLFDGQSACSLVTHPRFENLIYWFPVIAIAAAWRNRTESQAGRHPSSSESR